MAREAHGKSRLPGRKSPDQILLGYKADNEAWCVLVDAGCSSFTSVARAREVKVPDSTRIAALTEWKLPAGIRRLRNRRTLVINMRKILASIALLGSAACDSPPSMHPDTLFAVAEGQPTIAYAKAVSGSIVFDTSRPPVAFETLSSGPGCSKPRAGRGAKAAYVYTYGGGIHVPLQYVSFPDSPEQVEQRRRSMRESRSSRPQGSFAQNAIMNEASAFMAGNTVEWASRIDVLVTETEAPVFLYLSSYDPILWNIQLAPGAKLDGVVVNSYDAGMIANGTDPARTALVSYDNSASAKCYVPAPVRAIPVAQRVAAAKKINPDFNPRPYMKEWEADYRKGQRFDTEVTQLLGKRPDWVITRSADGNGINAILVGPTPAAPVALQPIVRLQVPSHITTFWGSRSDAFKAFGMEEAV